MNAAAALCLLDDFAVVRFCGADAAKFLQGQLSNDLGRLERGSILRAGLHNSQGRTLALLWLAANDPGDILALLPRELADSVMAQLRRYLLRAKLTISDESTQTQVLGRAQRTDAALPEGFWRLDSERAIGLLPAGAALPHGDPMTREQWRALDVAHGMPQVYGATSGQFVAQMLNLDCVDAISFTKGCYTGQEVIARAHYRGRVKRRMQRFESADAARLAPGDAGRLEDGRSFRVIEAVARNDGGSEFLAVAPMTDAGRDVEEAMTVAMAAGSATLRVRSLPLPYPLPQ